MRQDDDRPGRLEQIVETFPWIMVTVALFATILFLANVVR
jgi:hypothetical protein